MLTACAIAVSFEHVLYILGASAALSVIVGLLLVNRHNRLLVKNFQRDTYYGNVSGKVIRRESADKNYHPALHKARQRKFAGKLAPYCFLLLCITATGLILAPDIRHAIQASKLATAANPESFTETATSDLAVSINNTINREQQPVWDQGVHRGNISASLSAVEYQNSSDGLYRPDIRLSCRQNKYSVSFSIIEILGTDTTRLSVTSDSRRVMDENWQLSESYYAASANTPNDLINLLRTSNKITIAYRPFASGADKVSTFDLRGSAKAIAIFKERCKDQLSA